MSRPSPMLPSAVGRWDHEADPMGNQIVASAYELRLSEQHREYLRTDLIRLMDAGTEAAAKTVASMAPYVPRLLHEILVARGLRDAPETGAGAVPADSQGHGTSTPPTPALGPAKGHSDRLTGSEAWAEVSMARTHRTPSTTASPVVDIAAVPDVE